MKDPERKPATDLPAGISLSSDAIENLDHLLSAVSPNELRENLMEIYHTYLIHAHHMLPLDFDKLAMNMYLLINCLGSIDNPPEGE